MNVLTSTFSFLFTFFHLKTMIVYVNDQFLNISNERAYRNQSKQVSIINTFD